MLKYFAIIPILHIIICYVYLYFIYLGFGANITALATVENIFSVSLSSITPIYLLIISALTYTHLVNVNNPLQITDRERFELHPDATSRYQDLLSKILPWVCIAALVLNYYLRNSISILLIILLATPLIGKYTAEFALTNKFDLRFLCLLFAAIIIVFPCFLYAYSTGFSYRHDTYEKFEKSYIKCDDTLLLFAVGENFIGVDRDNKRSIVNSECETVFFIPNSKATLWITL